jgi:hypothetical protein
MKKHTANALEYSGGLGSRPRQLMWDLWWTKLHWDRFLSESFGFPRLISFHFCSEFTHISTGGCAKGPLETQFHRDIVSPQCNKRKIYWNAVPLAICIFHNIQFYTEYKMWNAVKRIFVLICKDNIESSKCSRHDYCSSNVGTQVLYTQLEVRYVPYLLVQ